LLVAFGLIDAVAAFVRASVNVDSLLPLPRIAISLHVLNVRLSASERYTEAFKVERVKPPKGSDGLKSLDGWRHATTWRLKELRWDRRSDHCASLNL
jgi:hypothetical protein